MKITFRKGPAYSGQMKLPKTYEIMCNGRQVGTIQHRFADWWFFYGQGYNSLPHSYPLDEAKREAKKHFSKAFTLIEVLVCVAIVATLILVFGCSKRVNGPTLIEAAKVLACYHKDASNYEHFEYTYHYDFMAGEFRWGWEPQTEYYPEIFTVTFKCQHGTFTIDGDRGRDCFERLSPGQSVAIHYQKEFEVSKAQTNFVDLHFVAAIPHTFKPEGTRMP